MAAPASLRSPTFLLAAVLFFLSGLLGLGYELIWVRKAALVVGASQMALATVVTAFFLGLAAGSAVVGSRLRSRRLSPLFVYGLFEAAIGAFALAFPALFRLMESAYGGLYPLVEGSAPGLFALRFLLLFALFFVPTFFMGGTLPLLLDGLVERDESIGPSTSLLYGLNILGAVAGVLITSYLAIPGLGMDGASRWGGCLNLAIGLAAMLAFARRRPIHLPEGPEPLDRFFPAAAAASGLLALGFQVAWARYFSLFNTPSVHLTAIILAVFLLALAAGSFLLAPLLGARRNPLIVLCWAQALVPLAVIGSLGWWRAAEHRFALHAQVLESGAVVPLDTFEIDPGYHHHWRLLGESADAIFFAPLFQVGLVVFLPAALMGMGLPSLIAAAASRAGALRGAAGRIAFWNTLGCAAGGFAAGYALLPLLGLHRSLCLLSLGAAALAAAAGMKAGLRKGLLAPALLSLAPVLVFLGAADVTTATILRHGYGRSTEVVDESRSGQLPETGTRLVEVLEGPLGTSFVMEDEDSLRIGSGNVCLAAAMKTRPSSQAIQGHLPCLFYPGRGAPETCLGICLGSGQSFGALLLYPIRRLDVVDISPEVVDLSLRHFGPYQHGLDRDPRVRRHLDDGRHFVARAADASYDVVTLEPPPPTSEGVASLYSIEFYREVARVLRRGGVFLQWLPLYSVTPLDALGIIRTQAAVFPQTFVMKVDGGDFMVASYPEPPRFHLEAIRERVRVLAKERLLDGFRWNDRCRHDLASLEGVLSLLVMAPRSVAELEGGMVYLDDHQLLSHSSGDRWLLRRYEGPYLSGLSFAALRPSRFAELAAFFEPPLGEEMVRVLEAERAAALAEHHAIDPAAVEALEREMAGASPPRRVEVALALAGIHDRALAKEEAFRWMAVAAEALEAGRAPPSEEQLEAARSVVRRRLAVYEGITGRSVEDLRRRFPASPLVEAMTEELRAYRAREAERLSGYWGR